MGCYVNPPSESKEAFLQREGRRVSTSDAGTIDFETSAELPVCLVNNGMFTAAGVAYDREEFNAFANPDGRSKVWYMVDRMKLFDVSDLAGYIC
jgi:hypothetical protein